VYRRVLAAATVAAAALIVAHGAQARHAPTPPRARVARVSSTPPFPYIAPWQTGFSRYSTQLFTPTRLGTTSLIMTVPAGQWWRIVYLLSNGTMSAVVANRQWQLTIATPAQSQAFRATGLVPLTASQAGQMIFAPDIGTFVNSTITIDISQGMEIPDALWPPASIITMNLNGAQAGDFVNTASVFAIETYTEQYDNGAPVLVPTPALP